MFLWWKITSYVYVQCNMFTTGNMARLYIWSMWNQSAGPRGVWSLELTLTHVKGRTESSQNKGGKDEGINMWLKPPQTELWYLFISYLSMITVVSFMASLHPRLCVIACATQLHLHVCVCVCVHINIHVWYRHECVHLRENYFVSRERSSCGRRHAQTLSNHSAITRSWVFSTRWSCHVLKIFPCPLSQHEESRSCGV